jgi:hypothetical protein
MAHFERGSKLNAVHLAQLGNRFLVYFGIGDDDGEESRTAGHASPLRLAAGLVLGGAVAGTLFGLWEHDVVAGVFFGAVWAVLMALRGAYGSWRRARRSARPS